MKKQMTYGKIIKTTQGLLGIYSNGEAVTGLYMAFWERGKPLPKVEKDGSSLECIHQAKLWLELYFKGIRPDFTPPLAPQGTPFQKRVWEILLEIPYGSLMTYGEIAARIANERGIARMSAQAVGQAVGSNPISLIIPCHRVIGTNGKMTGYGGGLEVKRRLLSLEGIDVTKLTMPQTSRFF